MNDQDFYRMGIGGSLQEQRLFLCGCPYFYARITRIPFQRHYGVQLRLTTEGIAIGKEFQEKDADAGLERGRLLLLDCLPNLKELPQAVWPAAAATTTTKGD